MIIQVSKENIQETDASDFREEVGVDAMAMALIDSLIKSQNCIRIFIAGDKTHCGKTTIALGLLGALYRSGVPASSLAYIKPATQVGERQCFFFSFFF